MRAHDHVPCTGLYAGSKYAAMTLWMAMAYDEIRVRLIQVGPNASDRVHLPGTSVTSEGNGCLFHHSGAPDMRADCAAHRAAGLADQVPAC